MRPAVRAWFEQSFAAPTRAQALGMPVIAERRSTLLLAPTGSGKTLAAFLAAIERVMFEPRSDPKSKSARVLYVSPLKALAVDIEKNLRAPIVGVMRAASALGLPLHEPSVFVRSGDTPSRERAAFLRGGADLVITTPESLYLMLTSEAAKHLAGVETVIVDEIHAMAGTKRGSHLWLTLERLEALRPASAGPLQRIGLTATVRPLEAIATVLGGYAAPGQPRPVTIVDAGTKRAVDVTIEVPVEDMRNLSERDTGPESGGAGAGGSIWPSIFPRLYELIRAHRTTLLFVNNRRLAERIAQALNDIAAEDASLEGGAREVALAHHGSIAHDRRVMIEDRLKSGTIPAIVATSSLELGIDMGAIDLVVQIEAPPSVAAGLQRVGRAGHQASLVSKGVIVPKFRADLLACAATARAMVEGEVEATSVPQNPLDVLAQQIVAITAAGPIGEAALFDLVRRAAPYHGLARGSFDGVLDMLAGRYPSDEFAELRPRIVWDRVTGTISPRHGTRRLAILSGGTIPDRGLFGVFLDGAEKPVRIGELDEEMVFESRVGDVFLLGASSWRITEITHDRVLAAPAPGEAGRMPFWKGDKVGRPAELGKKIGALARTLAKEKPKAAQKLLEETYRLDRRAAKNLIAYVGEQKEATGEVPSDQVVVIERFMDELGDQRVCVLCPLGARVLAPWAMAVTARLAAERGLEVDAIWSDDGIVFRIADVEAAPDVSEFVPSREEAEELVMRGLDKTALFAARFRENAGRSLLLPRKSPQKRVPLWTQRKKSAELLAVASRYPSFPLVLETFRECLKDTLDIPSLLELLGGLESRAVRLVVRDTTTPSPFAASLLFSYVANFIYDGDAPLAERRAQALSLDQERLRELLGEVELRELLDPDAVREAGDYAAYKRGRPIELADHLHDLLLAFGDLDAGELRERVAPELDPAALVDTLVADRRAARVTIAGDARVLAVEDVARYRDALGVSPPPGVPVALLGSVEGALLSLIARYARTRGPFTAAELCARYGLGRDVALSALRTLVAQGKVAHGSFTPGGHGGAAGEEYVDSEVLRAIKRRSLAKLRKAVEPVPIPALARFLGQHHGVATPRSGHEALLSALEQLEGASLPISVWLEDVLPARVREFSPLMLDELCAAGEIVWRGVEPIAASDGRVAFYLTDRFALLAPAPGEVHHELAPRVHAVLERRGAIFFHELCAEVGAFAGDVLDALWDLIWAGQVTNDTTTPLRTKFGLSSRTQPSGRALRFRSRRTAPPGSEGRFSLLRGQAAPGATDRLAAQVELLLDRHGVLTREVAAAEGLVGGFSAIYPVLRAMEEAGRARRGYFVEGLGAAQFARAGTEERLRAVRDARVGGEEPEALILSALDPANPYGTVAPWPSSEDRLARTGGAYVVLIDGALTAYVPRGEQALVTFLPPSEPERGRALRSVARALAAWVEVGERKVLQLGRIDDSDAAKSEHAPVFRELGFVPSGAGLLRRRDGSFARPRRRG